MDTWTRVVFNAKQNTRLSTIMPFESSVFHLARFDHAHARHRFTGQPVLVPEDEMPVFRRQIHARNLPLGHCN